MCRDRIMSTGKLYENTWAAEMVDTYISDEENVLNTWFCYVDIAYLLLFLYG